MSLPLTLRVQHSAHRAALFIGASSLVFSLCANTAYAAIPSAIRGDINSDGVVNGTDLTTLISRYGNTGARYDQGDIDGTTKVNIKDLSILLSRYNQTAPTGQAGNVRLVRSADSTFDQYDSNPTVTNQQWMRDHYWRMKTYSPYFDSRTTWFPNSSTYWDAYAIYLGETQLVSDHPDWILKTAANGSNLYIPFACNGTNCPQYAADIGSPGWRNYWVNRARSTLALGNHAIWIDDVNMEFNVGDANGNLVAPYDPRTGTTMTYANWKRYMAEFMELVRTEFPGVEITQNPIWFADRQDGALDEPYIARQMMAADYINLERGFNDGGLTGGTGQWSIANFMNYIDQLHSMGRHVVIDPYETTDAKAWEYSLGGYLLINNGGDAMADIADSIPGVAWWSGYDVNLGNATGARTSSSGLWQRSFDNGRVLLNEPGNTSKTVNLGGNYYNLAGQVVTTVTLEPAEAVVLSTTP